MEKATLPTVSILMPVFNTEKYLETAIQSILNENFSNYEFLICDDGSTDKSLSIIEKFQRKDKRIKVFRNKNNSGRVSKVIKKLATNAIGKYLIVSDSDDVAHENRLQVLTEYAEKNTQHVLVYGKVEGKNEDLSIHKHFNQKPFSLFDLFKTNYIPDGAFLMKRDAYEQCGGIDTSIIWAEDYHLRLKLATIGSFSYIDTPYPLYLYRWHDTNYTLKNRNMNEELDFKKRILNENLKKIGTFHFQNKNHFEYTTFIYQLAYISTIKKNKKEDLLQWLEKLKSLNLNTNITPNNITKLSHLVDLPHVTDIPQTLSWISLHQSLTEEL